MRKKFITQDKSRIVGNISDFLGKHTEIVFAYIHGSFVRDGAFSDIDIGVYAAAGLLEDIVRGEIHLEEKMASILSLPIDIRILNAAPVSFAYRVIKESILVADKMPNLRAEYEGRIFRSYFDFALFRKRYLREVGHAPL